MILGEFSINTLSITGSAYRLLDTAKGYFTAESEQNDKDDHQTKTQDNQDDEKTSASLLSTGLSWFISSRKKLLMLASLGLAYYTHQIGYHDNYANQSVDISYAINGMDFTSYAPFQAASDWSFAISSSAATFAQLAMLYGASNLLSHSYQYNAENLFIAPLSLMTLFSFLPILPAQNIETEFLNVFGGSGLEYAYAVKITSSGDIVAVGQTNSFGAGNNDALVAKFCANGSLIWARALGGSGYDYARALAITPTDDIVIAGDTSSFGAGNNDALVTKLYANGSLVWARTLGELGMDSIYALALTPNNDIVVAGVTTSFGVVSNEFLIAKLYFNSSLVWACTLGGNSVDWAYALAVTATDDIVVTGETQSFGAGGSDVLIAKLNANGSLAWARTLGDSGYEYGFALALTPTDDIVIAGSTITPTRGTFVAKLYANGSLAWAETLGGNSSDSGYALALTLTPNDDIVIAGQTNSFGAGSNDALIAKFYTNGTLAWARTLGGNSTDNAHALALTDVGGIVVVGNTNSFGAGSDDVLLAKFNTNGTSSGCNLPRVVQPIVLNWSTINNTVIVPTFTSLNTIGIFRNWTTISTQFITPQELRLCLADDISMSIQSSTITATSMVSTSLTTSNLSSTSQTAISLPSNTFSSTSNTPAPNTNVSPSSANSASLTSAPAFQSSTAYVFNVSVSTTPITIEQGISTTLTSSILSISGNASPSQVIYTIIGNNPDIIITLNGLEVTQFTQEDVEGNFVEIAIPGVTCGDDYSTDLQLEANVADSNAPAQQVSINLLFDITTCSYAGRFSLFSYRDTHIGFWANNNPKERAEKEVKVIPSTKENTVNSINFGH